VTHEIFWLFADKISAEFPAACIWAECDMNHADQPGTTTDSILAECMGYPETQITAHPAEPAFVSKYG
jgi:hypothetical protein